jgi:hypothetical protein
MHSRDLVLHVLLRALHIDHGGIERVVSHDLRQPMQRHCRRHAIPEAMPEVVRADILDLRQRRAQKNHGRSFFSTTFFSGSYFYLRPWRPGVTLVYLLS